MGSSILGQAYCFYCFRATLISKPIQISMQEGASLVWGNPFLPRQFELTLPSSTWLYRDEDTSAEALLLAHCERGFLSALLDY